MNEKLYIPKKIKVGFQQRSDTYTKKLAYVIYHDGKVWRKETSWNQWITKVIGSVEYEKQKTENYKQSIQSYGSLYDRCKGRADWRIHSYYKDNVEKKIDTSTVTKEEFVNEVLGDYENFKCHISGILDKSFMPVELDNVPTEGFVLNKKAGGHSSGWNHRQTYCRVYDPRGFEFEIDIENILYILEHCVSNKGKGLDGKFVYSWNGTNLVLLPTTSEEYTSSAEHTELQSKSIDKSDLKEGSVYKLKNGKELLYLGQHLYFLNGYTSSVSKKHIFIDTKNNDISDRDVKDIANLIVDKVDNYADYYQKFIDTNRKYDKKNISSCDKKIKTQGLYGYNLYGGTNSKPLCFETFYQLNSDGSYDFYKVYTGELYSINNRYNNTTLTKIRLDKISNITLLETTVKLKKYKDVKSETISISDFLTKYKPENLFYCGKMINFN